MQEVPQEQIERARPKPRVLPKYKNPYEVQLAIKFLTSDNKKMRSPPYIQLANQIIQYGQNKFGDTASIWITSAFFHAYYTQNWNQMSDCVRVARQCQPKITERYSLYELQFLIDSKIRLKKKGVEDFHPYDARDMFDVSTHTTLMYRNQMMAAMKQVDLAKMYIRQVWMEMCKENCDIGTTMKLLEKTVDNQKQAQMQLLQLLSEYPRSPNLLRTYAVMSRDIDRDDEKAHQLMAIANRIEEEDSNINEELIGLFN
ncbi:MAG: hypothetical protein EZS28_014119 [Streblomastix strix]|uniref:TmcB/TmcC TPR repeats domain-containing protein n=1 Tax=Streblomastix strix TaxID=222440 RepID=A0A5J4W6P1_9EUKA|nr:MAG: hypothetical protein EZS28_014119 [Streblomastix strix]